MRPRTGDNAEVFVVGAGPVGLSAGLILCKSGFRTTIIEADSQDRVRPGSRALFVHGQTLRMLAKYDSQLVKEITDHGLLWHTNRTRYRGKEVFCQHFKPQDKATIPPFCSLRQVQTERFLLQACIKAGVNFIWKTPVSRVVSQSSHVEISATDGRQWHCAYLVAADGARSAVRHSLDIAMDGCRSEGFHVVVDIADVENKLMPLERVFHYEHPGVGGRNVLIVPFSGGFQVDLQCNDDDKPSDFSSQAKAKQWLAEVIEPKFLNDIQWISQYRFMQVVAQRMVDQHCRVLLVGESAHLFAPFGARGMNSGIADAEAAGKAIIGALSCDLSKSDNTFEAKRIASIMSFEQERMKAALHNRDAVNAALMHLRPTGFVGKFKRRAALLLAPKVERAGLWLEEGPYAKNYGKATDAGGKY